MPAPGCPLRIKQVKGIAVVTFRDRILLDTFELQLIEEELSKLVASETCNHLLNDFQDVQALSSQMIGTLLKVHEQLSSTSRKMALCNLQPKIEEIFGITQLKKVFSILANQAKAIKMLSKN